MTFATTLIAAQIQAAQTQAQNIANSATTAVSNKTFVFVAAFDGTNNDRNNLALAKGKKGSDSK